MLKWAFMLLAISATVLLAGGTYIFFRLLLFSPQVAWWVKVGFAAATLGLLLLLLAVVREQLRASRRESFREVDK